MPTKFRDADTGVVVIGRNEGLRLQRCLESLSTQIQPVVYVDSGSSDDSVEQAQKRGCHVLNLDTAKPFTAGRARNEGLSHLLRSYPKLEYVQFVDGDCELQAGWLTAARTYLVEHPRCAIVCGRRRERYPKWSVYNRLCDMEWDTPIGDAASCGGDFLARVTALRNVAGFDPKVIAGEEPEMCFRLRRMNWAIARIEAEMTLHDAAMARFSQFWQRARRSGHAYVQLAVMHCGEPGRFQQREVASILFWTLVPPLGALLAGTLAAPAALLPLCAYPLLWVKILCGRLRAGSAMASAAIYATFIPIGKFAQCVGVTDFLRRKVAQQQFQIIEYK
ncbi:glycosyltransferase family A protein [Microbulbifer hainanensis]|uniref:glycosyltransferase family A protein n=1 Tax=Microbulbifer hainanensis TaxID=2735675 RepID=UPI001D00A1C7|nr:glycosyltransferase family A protein [Microbulbifer hainanensis]